MNVDANFTSVQIRPRPSFQGKANLRYLVLCTSSTRGHKFRLNGALAATNLGDEAIANGGDRGAQPRHTPPTWLCSKRSTTFRTQRGRAVPCRALVWGTQRIRTPRRRYYMRASTVAAAAYTTATRERGTTLCRNHHARAGMQACAVSTARTRSQTRTRRKMEEQKCKARFPLFRSHSPSLHSGYFGTADGLASIKIFVYPQSLRHFNE